MKKFIITAFITTVGFFSYSQDLPLTAGSGSSLSGDLYFNSNTKAIIFGSNPSTNPYIQGSSSNGLYFGNGGSAKYTMDGSGNNSWTGSGTFGGTLSATEYLGGSFRIQPIPISSTTGGSKFQVVKDNVWSDALNIAYDKSVILSGALTGKAATFVGSVNVGNGLDDNRIISNISTPYALSLSRSSGTYLHLGASLSGELILSNQAGNQVGSWSQAGVLTATEYQGGSFRIQPLPVSSTTGGSKIQVVKDNVWSDALNIAYDKSVTLSGSVNVGNGLEDNRIISNISTPYALSISRSSGTYVHLGANLSGDLVLSNQAGNQIGSWSQTGVLTGTSAMFSGNVGIGTTTPDSKLTVAGNIHSREVKVSVNAGADFVFEKGYQLKKLDVLEKYLQENKHLPEVASAEDMKKNGIEVGEMNIKLLQKIEELTLHLIEQNKRFERQDEKMKEQDKKIEKQQLEINQMKFNSNL